MISDIGQFIVDSSCVVQWFDIGSFRFMDLDDFLDYYRASDLSVLFMFLIVVVLYKPFILIIFIFPNKGSV